MLVKARLQKESKQVKFEMFMDKTGETICYSEKSEEVLSRTEVRRIVL